VLATLLAGSVSSTWGASGKADGGVRAQVLRVWDSGNALLAPLSRHRGAVLFAGDQTLGRIDPQAAKPAWNVAHGFADELVFKPRAAGAWVVAGGAGAIAGWNVERGQRKWAYQAETQLGVPFVTETHSYVGDGHALVAIAHASGRPAWRFEGTPDTLASYAPSVVGNQVLFSPGNGILYCLRRSDGQLQWQLDRSNEWQYLRQLYVTGDVLVAGSYKELLYGISLQDGRVLWTFNAGNFINSHHVAGPSAYLWSPTGWVYAIDARDGNVRWRHQTTDYGQAARNWGPMMAELASLGERVFALDMNHVLHVLHRDSGEELQRVVFEQALQPCVLPLTDNTAMVATEAGRIERVTWRAA
jgi:outer membrane protein assembly factor BamB